MRYRDAKLLQAGDTVVSKSTGVAYKVKDIEVYGSVSTVRVNCQGISFFHSELEEKDNNGTPNQEAG